MRGFQVRTHINDVRQAIHGVIQPPQVTEWLTVYASPDAGNDEMIRVLTEKMQQIIDDDPSCSPFWGRATHHALQELCRGTWWRRIVARGVIEHIVRQDVRSGTITTTPGFTMDNQQSYLLSLRQS